MAFTQAIDRKGDHTTGGRGLSQNARKSEPDAPIICDSAEYPLQDGAANDAASEPSMISPHFLSLHLDPLTVPSTPTR